MFILAYFVSIVIFYISHLIVTSILLSIYVLIVGFIQRTIIGYSDANTHFINQFLSASLGILISVYFSVLSFNWFDATPSMFILLPFCGFLWVISHININPVLKPIAQKLGAGVGFFIAYLLF